MQSDNYFEIFGLGITFRPDLQKLKSTFYKLSRAVHPDFFTGETLEIQEEMLRKSSLINKAYKTLTDESERMKYILVLNDFLGSEENHVLEPSFLMEMMDINEVISDLQSSFDQRILMDIQRDVKSVEDQLNNEVVTYINQYEIGQNKESSLEKIKVYYLKSKYLLRIKENISTFAHLNEIPS